MFCSRRITSRAMASHKSFGTISIDSVSSRIKNFEYAVRGDVVLRSQELEKDLKENPKKYNFQKLIPANIGNPQAVGSLPIDYYRQLLSLMTNPELVDALQNTYPSDIIQRAKNYIQHGVKLGAYSHSKGYTILREEIAQGLLSRDNHPCNIEDIYLTNGASTGVKSALEILIQDSSDGILIPIPQYPLYAATITKLGGSIIPYYLNEESNWSIDIPALEEIMKSSSTATASPKVRALVIINPGNPTSNLLSYNDMKQIITLCSKYKITLLADEVYQDNIYTDKEVFTSFRKVLLDMKEENVSLFSFHSASKGFAGECGIRGGYFTVNNISSDICALLYKMQSVDLCSNIAGQVMMAMLSKPPMKTDDSYINFNNDKEERMLDLRRKASYVYEQLNKIDNISCTEIISSMYAFPTITLPQKFIDECKKQGKEPDSEYCIRFLDYSGVIFVPGNGFGQKEGTYHFRMTILPSYNDLQYIVEKIKSFHTELFQNYQ